MYDWANSAFATTVMAGFFPIFFKKYWSYGADVNLSTAQLGLGNSLASLLVALMAPVLGSIADKTSAKKKFLIFFAYLGVLMIASLFLISKGSWVLAIFVYVMGSIGFSGSLIFYDALLPQVAEKKNLDKISGLGYAMGYLGGGLLFLFNVLMTLNPDKFGLADAGEAVRYSFLSVAVWWGAFTLFTILWVQEDKLREASGNMIYMIGKGFKEVAGTFREIKNYKPVFLFLLAYWCYIDGVDTIVRMAVDYGMSLGFDSNDLIIALLITQFVGFPAALGFGKLGQHWGARRSIFLALGVYIVITLWGMMMTNKTEFYVLAGAIGLVMGGIQALSRSYYARLIPEDQPAKFFGFYNMLGKFAAIVGPLLVGFTGLAVKRILLPPVPDPGQVEQISRLASRCSIASLLILFILGGVLLYFVREEKPIQ
jgi:UMF1 family MFS transporter